MHSNQYGFQKFLSTEYAAFHLFDYLSYEIASRLTATTIYLDLLKAFDFLSHFTLLDKLKFHGINEMAIIKLMNNYLQGIKNYFIVNFIDHSLIITLYLHINFN